MRSVYLPGGKPKPVTAILLLSHLPLKNKSAVLRFTMLLYAGTKNFPVLSPTFRLPTASLVTLGRHLSKGSSGAGHQWLMPIILATQEAEIRKIVV
jgi:hypothetical protein